MTPEAACVTPDEITVTQDPAVVVESLAAKQFDSTNTAQGWWRPDKVATMFGGTGTTATSGGGGGGDVWQRWRDVWRRRRRLAAAAVVCPAMSGGATCGSGSHT
ncbi:unnamed protein product [Cuscuta epithymum]|uniref:Uncharacterized protein n=1 Tax=Cuscuta epithymum TaxID=186058 RepID=A0AAV0EKK1_9ASTE|nr:unnamed protein product [Cuscuta epithymum]